MLRTSGNYPALRIFFRSFCLLNANVGNLFDIKNVFWNKNFLKIFVFFLNRERRVIIRH